MRLIASLNISIPCLLLLPLLHPHFASALDGLVVFDLEENEIIHASVTVGDFDEPCTECALESYQGFWTLSPESCCTGTNDVVLAEVEPALAALAATAVEASSWGQIKAGFDD